MPNPSLSNTLLRSSCGVMTRGSPPLGRGWLSMEPTTTPAPVEEAVEVGSEEELVVMEGQSSVVVWSLAGLLQSESSPAATHVRGHRTYCKLCSISACTYDSKQ